MPKKKYKILKKVYVSKTIEAEDLAEVKDWMSRSKCSDYNHDIEAHTIYDVSTGKMVENTEAWDNDE